MPISNWFFEKFMELTISKREISKNSPPRGNLIFVLKAIAPEPKENYFWVSFCLENLYAVFWFSKVTMGLKYEVLLGSAENEIKEWKMKNLGLDRRQV